MPSRTSPAPSRRRQRAEIESDDEADNLRGSQRSTPSTSSGKRARTNGYQSSDVESAAPAVQSTNGFRKGGGYNVDDDDDDGQNGDPNTFQPGALIRVKLTNFVTYERAEFFPGPNLNMVIGPNGTGKSSLVCAICLGLGWGPKHLGRASEIGEFVKHNMSEAQIEIELQKRPDESSNHVVRLRIIREGNSREWFLDGKKTSHKAIQELTASYSIQVDNLCQFLPQDKVAEFAALSPVNLLLQTQRAAAPPEMLLMHEKLKEYRKEQKSLESHQTSDKEQLLGWETRQANLHAEVLKLQERQEVQHKVKMLEYTRPFVEYRNAQKEHLAFKEAKEEAKERYKELSKKVKPLLETRDAKEKYAKRIQLAIDDHKAALRAAEQAADKKIQDISQLDTQIKKNEDDDAAVHQEQRDSKQEIIAIQRKIRNLEAQEKDVVVFDGMMWNKNIREKEQEDREFRNQFEAAVARHTELKNRGRDVKNRIDLANQELAAFDTQEGRQMSNLARVSKDTARAWQWVQEHLEEFEKEVYGPPMISCSVTDPRYTIAVESMLGKNDFLAITAQTTNDMKKLSDQLLGKMHLKDVTIKTADDNLQSRLQEARLSHEQLRDVGMDGWALDYIDGPLVVLCMLCNSQQLHKSGVTLGDINESQYNSIVASDMNKWTTKTSTFKMTKRTDYGPSAVSTTTKPVRPASWWVDQPVDTSARREIEERKRVALEVLQSMKTENESLKVELDTLKKQRSVLDGEIRALKKEKGDLQTAYTKWAAIPQKILVEKEALQARKDAATQFEARIKLLQDQFDLAVVRKSKYALDHKDLVEKIRDCHDELLEAQVRLIEAQSDHEGLTARNEDIVKQLEDEETRKIQAEQDAKRVTAVAREALAVCKALLADEETAPYRDQFQTPPPDLTLESLDIEIAAEKSKLDYIHAGNPNAIKEYERRQVDVVKLREKVEATEAKVAKLEQRIDKIRGKWEPRLDALIAEISDAFSHNFEQIGCAGSVSIHKDDDFDLWAIQIKVKFRANEDLQILDAHRQSGGERSVSTIFYLMSLQALARAPFRVVDEINQGMDPRNERMVHERMVEIACKEHTSQYFLITPKLLTGLRYDKRMKLLCIASGEFMPNDYRKLDVSKIIGIQRAIIAAQ